jgi:hypothetical protein
LVAAFLLIGVELIKKNANLRDLNGDAVLMNMTDNNYFTPMWNTELFQSNIGNGSLGGWVDEYDSVHIVLTVGNNTEIGKGDWGFIIPQNIGKISTLGYAEAYKKGFKKYYGYVAFDPMHRNAIPIFPGTTGDYESHYPVERYRPFTWGNGDKLRISFNKVS